MRNRRTAALLALLIIFTCIFQPLASVHTLASTRLTVTEGSGVTPDIRIVRTDENGNEIVEDDASGDTGEEDKGASGSGNGTAAVNNTGRTYENDLRGSAVSINMADRQDVYISTVDDLIRLADDCSLDTWSKDKNVILENDIDTEGSDFKYIPIFGGIFDGQGHTISGLSIKEEESYTGLFCIVQTSAVIKNLNVKGTVTPSGKQLATGGIAGDNYGLISNCTFEGSIEGYDYTGAIAGYNEESGNISSCTSRGVIQGRHFTGGITGYNMGMINGCTNEAKINITTVEDEFSVKDIDVSKYTNNLMNIFGDNNKQDSTSVLNSTVDIGGICGYSQGTIISCTNEALVGYEHVGYNVGGIVGRQNGYVQLCVNNGEVFGRKDVGGIAGQAEPYVIIDITKDIVGQLTSNMNTLHDLVNVTLNDAGSESDIISARLNMVKSFTDKALNDTSYLTNETEDFINGIMNSGTEFMNRVDYILEETSKNGGALDHTKQATDNASNALNNLTNAVKDLELSKYMSDEERKNYEQTKEDMDKGTDVHRKLRDKYYASDYKFTYYRYINRHHEDPSYYGTSSNLVPIDVSGNEIPWPSVDDKEAYSIISRIAHKNEGGDPPYTDFPSKDETYFAKDNRLDSLASADATIRVDELADEEFYNEYGMTYAVWLGIKLDSLASYLLAHASEMGETTERDIRYAVDSTKQSVKGLSAATGDLKSVLSDVSSKSDIAFPKLSDEYKVRSNSLIANIQGMSDNLGFLNNEVNSSNQQLLDDMIKVNDQFNVIMLLIADAIDGVLDADYTDLYEDDSLSVADSSTDATIADSLNNGTIHGDIDTSGIAGTMAIEYDFDLESDITGIKDASSGTTYRSKCVLRNNKNNGHIEGLKSYVGGVCGLQEMGTVLRCQNYGKLTSKSGNFVGGITGKSLSIIKDCLAKGILKGQDNIGGITGLGYDISGCYSLPSIDSDGSYLGAIAGDNNQKGRLNANYFVCDEHAGVDRVSYNGKAEPIPYEQLVSTDSIPSEFRKIKVSFLVDDEIISVKEYNYGDAISSLPLDINDNEYILWDWENARLNNLHSDAELNGTKARYITTLAGSQLRESGQSAVLVDGKFIDGDRLVTKVTGESSDPDIFESWELIIPEDYSADHLIRYCPPENIDEVRIWLLNGTERTKVECTNMGKYYTFTTSGIDVRFEVESVYVNPIVKYAKYELIGGGVLLGIILLLLSGKKNKDGSGGKDPKSGGKGPGPGDKRNRDESEGDGSESDGNGNKDGSDGDGSESDGNGNKDGSESYGSESDRNGNKDGSESYGSESDGKMNKDRSGGKKNGKRGRKSRKNRKRGSDNEESIDPYDISNDSDLEVLDLDS